MLLTAWLKKQPKSKGDPLDALAKKLGISRTSMRRIVEGQQWPKPDLMRKIKKATGNKVTADDILAGIDNRAIAARSTARRAKR